MGNKFEMPGVFHLKYSKFLTVIIVEKELINVLLDIG